MKKIFTAVLLLLICFSAKGQVFNGDVFDFEPTDTFYYYDWLGGASAEQASDRLIIDTINYKHNQWQIGKPKKRIFDSSYTLPNAIVTDTSRPCLPNDTSVFYVKLPFTSYPYIYGLRNVFFAYRLDIDSGDIALAEASIDSGQTWTNILTDTIRGWWVYSIDTPNLSVSTIGWDSVQIYTWQSWVVPNDTVYLRFTFITGSDTTARDGWMIDHIVGQHDIEDVPNIANDNAFQLYPCPATNETKLKFTKGLNTDCEMTVVDALGKQVFRNKLDKGSTGYTLNVGDWVKGVYFIELDDGRGGRAMRKLMVE